MFSVFFLLFRAILFRLNLILPATFLHTLDKWVNVQALLQRRPAPAPPQPQFLCISSSLALAQKTLDLVMGCVGWSIISRQQLPKLPSE